MLRQEKQLLQKLFQVQKFITIGYEAKVEALNALDDAIAIILADWGGHTESDEITGIPQNKNNGNSGFSGGCMPRLVTACLKRLR